MSDLSNREFKTELFEQFARVSQALSSGKRLELLELLAQGERSVDALTQLTGMTAANTSQHLQQLRKAGLVASRKDGLFVIYRIAGGGVVRLLMALRDQPAATPVGQAAAQAPCESRDRGLLPRPVLPAFV